MTTGQTDAPSCMRDPWFKLGPEDAILALSVGFLSPSKELQVQDLKVATVVPFHILTIHCSLIVF